MQCYYQYKKIKAQYPNTAMGGFTRLLHSGAADAYMEEIPTVVVDQLPHKYQQIANVSFIFYVWMSAFFFYFLN